MSLEILSVTGKDVEPTSPYQMLDAELAGIEPGKVREVFVALADSVSDERKEEIANQAKRALSAFARARWGVPAQIAVEILAEGIKLVVRRTRPRQATPARQATHKEVLVNQPMAKGAAA